MNNFLESLSSSTDKTVTAVGHLTSPAVVLARIERFAPWPPWG